jgi:hypothetical protein
MIIEIKEPPQFKVGDIVISRELIKIGITPILHIVTKIKGERFESLPFLKNYFTGEKVIKLIDDHFKAPTSYSITIKPPYKILKPVEKYKDNLSTKFMIVLSDEDIPGNQYCEYIDCLELCYYKSGRFDTAQDGYWDVSLIHTVKFLWHRSVKKKFCQYHGSIILRNAED